MFSYRGSRRNLGLAKLSRRMRRVGRIENLEDRRLLAVLTVDSASDDGPGTLRQAIVQSNGSAEKDQIVFSIPGASPKITLATPLPAITNPVEIDASTQPAYAGQPLVQIDGAQLGQGVFSAFSLQAGGSTVRGLSLTGFDNAIYVTGPGGNVIEGNFLGLSPSGQASGNEATGVSIVDSANNTIGGSTALARNVISASGQYGIRIGGTASQSNRIQGNYIGTNGGGTAAVANTIDGILIADGAGQTTIGTDGDGTADASEGNLISGNGQFGIELSGSTYNVIAGNFLGTTANGSAALANGDSGVKLAGVGAKYNHIGTNGDGVSDTAERNVISGNGVSGITISNGSENVVAGNFIGTSSSGLAALKNDAAGVLLTDNARINWIGTNSDGKSDGSEGNLISGNGTNGITISNSHANIVAGNLIGLSASGNAALTNGQNGVAIVSGSNGNVIGTDDNGVSDVAERNIISGNQGDGVAIQSSHFNHIAGNYIGTNQDGTAKLGNASGISLSDSVLNVIGTDNSSRQASTGGNVISGNLASGIIITGNASVSNSIGGNLVGLSASGTQALGNAQSGIVINGNVEGNLIGGQRPEQRNVISGNGQYGILLTGKAHGTTVLGNRIGLASSGTTALGNALAGIAIDDAYDNAVGADSAEAANEIAYNGAKGIVVTNAASINNRIERNTIYGHSVIGIDLGNDGATANDATDADTGPNGLQNYPVIQSATSASGTTHVAGTLFGEAGTTYLLRFYAKSGAGNAIDAIDYLGSKEVNATSAGQLNWTADLPTSLASDRVVIATARSSVAGTSEFSPSDNAPASTWHNPTNPLDVNGNGSVSPLDALLIINVLNTSGAGSVSRLTPPSDGSKLYVDTNNDGFVSPLDALLVINYLNSGAGNSEGEALQAALPALHPAAVDRAFFDFDGLRKKSF